MAPTLYLALVLLFFPNFILAEPLHIPVTRRRDIYPRDSEYWARIANGIRTRYGYQTATSPFSHRSNRRAVGATAMLDQGLDSSYAGTVNVGTPPQEFQVVLDTGSADLWLPGLDCTKCSSGTPFDTSKSSTFKQTDTELNIAYGSGDVNGTVGSDTVTMGGLTVAAQVLLIVTQMTVNLVNGPISGLIGLGFQKLASTGAVPFWEAVAGQLDSPEMSFWFERNLNPVNETSLGPGGVFTLGGTNSSLFIGDIEFHNLVSTPSFWLLTLSSITLNGAAVTLSSATLAAIDTGTTLIGGPHDDVVRLYSLISGAVTIPNQPGFYAFPCSTNVSISMSFGGNLWPINLVDMSTQISSGSNPICQGSIFDLSLGTDNVGPGPDWVVGDTFLKNVYTVFRSSPASVGFAQLSNAAGGSGTPSAGSSPNKSSAMSTTIPAFLMLSTSFIAVIMLCL